MRVQTAIALLRAARSRFEDWGFIQLGSKEFIAIEWAYQQTNNAHLKELELGSLTVIAKSHSTNTFGLPLFGVDHLKALREGYKALENLPSTAEFHAGPINPQAGQEAENEESINTSDWIKALNLDENEILKSLQQPDTTPE